MPFSDGAWDYSAGKRPVQLDGSRNRRRPCQQSIPWVGSVACTRPASPSGMYDCVAGPALTNLLLSKKVDLVLNGHEHHYQRSKQLATAAGCTGLQPNAYNPSCVRDPDNALDKDAGAVFATVGTGGRPLRNVNAADAEAPYFAAYSGLNSNPSHGLLDLQFTSTSMNAAFVATNGTYTDAFSIAPAGSNPPTTSFTASPASGTVPLTVNFTDTSTGSPTSWAWDFGDGGTATTQNPSHTYSTAGTYTARLTATNAAGSTSSTRTITVNPPGGPAAPVASFTATPTSGTVPLTVNFTDTSTGSPTSWAWDFGDGGTATTQNPSRTYTTARDLHGKTDSYQRRGLNLRHCDNHRQPGPTGVGDYCPEFIDGEYIHSHHYSGTGRTGGSDCRRCPGRVLHRGPESHRGRPGGLDGDRQRSERRQLVHGGRTGFRLLPRRRFL